MLLAPRNAPIITLGWVVQRRRVGRIIAASRSCRRRRLHYAVPIAFQRGQDASTPTEYATERRAAGVGRSRRASGCSGCAARLPPSARRVFGVSRCAARSAVEIATTSTSTPAPARRPLAGLQKLASSQYRPGDLRAGQRAGSDQIAPFEDRPETAVSDSSAAAGDALVDERRTWRAADRITCATSATAVSCGVDRRRLVLPSPSTLAPPTDHRAADR